MNLICPNCGSNEIEETGLANVRGAGYGSMDQRYSCKKCGYTGPLIIDTDKEEDEPVEEIKKDFPYLIVLIIGFIAAAAYGLGAGLMACVLFFSIPTAMLLVFHFFVKDEDKEGVEKDLENLTEDGIPKEQPSIEIKK